MAGQGTGHNIAALAALKDGIKDGKGALELALNSLKFYTSLVASTNSTDIWRKNRPLQITVVNLHPDYKLVLEKWWFQSGKFWDQPFWPIRPGMSQTFSVCNKDFSICCGVSAGVAFRIYDRDSDKPKNLEISGSRYGWFVCAFSNPYVGSVKGKCALRAPEYDKWIPKLKAETPDDAVIREKMYGFYKGNLMDTDTEHGDRKLVFIFKSRDINW